MSKATVAVYQDEAGEWRWRLDLGNHKKFAASGESFDSRANAWRAAERMAQVLVERIEAEVRS